MSFEDDGVAARVIEARKIAGLTQIQLSTRANVSLSLIKKVERGAVPASPMFIASVARALGLLVTDLTDSHNFDSLQGSYGLDKRFVPDLERAIIEGENTLLEGPPHSLSSISLALKQVISQGRVGRYSEILEILPNLIRHLSIHSITTSSDQLELVNRLLAQAYYSAMFASYKFGHLSLSAWAAERMSTAASKSGDPLWSAMGHYSRSQALMFSGSYRANQLMLERAAVELSSEKDIRKVEVLGAVHLSSSIIAARLDKSATSDAHLQEARDLARYVSTAGDQFDTAFSAANVEIHAVAAAVESSEPSMALKRGRGLDLRGKLYPSRIGHYHIDLARAYFMQGAYESVIRELQLARQISPQQARYHPQVHELIRALARARRRSDPVARLGAWAGLK